MKKTDDENAAEAETREMLVDCRALLRNDHFVYISGDYGSGWVDKDSIFVEPKRVARLCELLAGANCTAFLVSFVSFVVQIPGPAKNTC